MNNPFEKKDHKLLIAGLLLGAAAAGAAVYFFRDELAGLIDGLLSSQSAEQEDHKDPQAYLHHTDKAPKTDREALLHHDFLHTHHEEQQN